MIPYLIIGVIVASIQTVLTAREPENKEMLNHEDKDKQQSAWVILAVLWFLNIFFWLPYVVFKYGVVPIIKHYQK